jgi:NADH:ubiquinone oxidoreductase subunit 2 (subunit N)
LINKYLNENNNGLAENLLYILIMSVILSLLSTFYYLRLIKMSVFDGFSENQIMSIEIRNIGEVVLPFIILITLGIITIGWVFMLYNLDII